MKCTSFEEQKGTRISGEMFILTLLASALFHLQKLSSDLFLFCWETKGSYQSSLNEVNFRDIMNVSPNILTNCFVDERTLITTTLISSCHSDTLVLFVHERKDLKTCF